MMTGKMTALAAVLLLASAPGAATQDTVPANDTTPADPVREPVPDPDPLAPPRETRPEPEPTTEPSEPIVTTVPVATPPPATVETLPDPAVNPYANAYNELLPLEEEEEDGFDWGLLGLLGLFGLIGLAGRRERVVYVERADTVVPPRSRDLP